MTGFRLSLGVSNRNIGREGLGLCWSGSAFDILSLLCPAHASWRQGGLSTEARSREAKKKGHYPCE